MPREIIHRREGIDLILALRKKESGCHAVAAGDTINTRDAAVVAVDDVERS